MKRKIKMKKIILAISAIALFSVACNKAKTTIEPSTSTTKNVRSEDEAITFVTDKIDGKIQYFTFENENEALSFLEEKGIFQDEIEKIKKTQDLREYAISIGEIENYEATGTISDNYTNYINANFKKSRGPGALHDNPNAGGSAISTGTTPQPTLYYFNDRAESASGLGLVNWLHDRTFFRGPSLFYSITLSNGPSFIINFAGFNFSNKAASAS